MLESIDCCTQKSLAFVSSESTLKLIDWLPEIYEYPREKFFRFVSISWIEICGFDCMQFLKAFQIEFIIRESFAVNKDVQRFSLMAEPSEVLSFGQLQETR